jgi:hypothetical protein
MRDPDYTPSWSDTFAFRDRYQDSDSRPENYEIHSRSPVSVTDPATVDGNDTSDNFDLESFLADSPVDDCEEMRLSSRSLSSLRSLPPTSLVLLLTPVLAPAYADHSGSESETTDPFEAFGRELSKHHRRLRHVPYLPRTGMTDTHLAFIEQAAAVVVVVCEPEDSDDVQSIEDQQFFADMVKREDATDDNEETPFVLVRFQSMGSEFIDDEYSNVLRVPALTEQACAKAAQLLFKTEM